MKGFTDDDTKVRFDSAERFDPGDRVEWDGRERGTVVRRLDEGTIAVRWDNPKMGTTMAPAWHTRLRIMVEDWDDRPTNPDVFGFVEIPL